MHWLLIVSIIVSITNVYTLVSIGANMDGLRDWSRSLPYVNLVRQARIWGSADKPWDGNCSFDPVTGWPKQDFGIVLATDSMDLGGAYLVYAKGNATIKVEVNGKAYISDHIYDVTTDTMTAYIHLPENSTDFFVSFRNTTGPGLQDVVILQPGYNLTEKSNFTKLMLAHLSRFSIIRFMDWTITNSNYETYWNETTPIDWPQYTPPKRNPWQTIPHLVNQINPSVNIWINLPHNATDDYIINVARLMQSNLETTHNIYVEYSNEVWNWQFPQSHANLAAANDSVLNHGDPYHFNYDNCSNAGYWAWRRTAYQIKHISDLFKTVFGNENVGPWKRVRPILAGQAVFPFVLRNGLEYLNTVFGPPSNFIHGIAIAPYFSLGKFASWDNLTRDQVLDAFNTSIQGMTPEQGWHEKAPLGAHAVFAAWYNLAVHGYEGGSDTSGTCTGNCSIQAKIEATRDPRLAILCDDYLTGWYRYGFQELNWFGAGANEVGKYGSWGLLEDMRQEILIDTTSMFNVTSPVAQLPRPSPKLKAVDVVRQSSVKMNFGIPVPSTNINATNFADHRVPYPTPDLRYLGPNATFYYPLEIRQSPIQINVTVYIAGMPGVLEAGINNEQFLEVDTPQTANYTSWIAAPVMQFKINQSTVPSLVALRLRVVKSGYNIRSFDVVLS